MGCNKLCCWGEAAPMLSLQMRLPKYNGRRVTNHEFQAVRNEHLKSRSGCCVREQDKGIFARFEPRYLSQTLQGELLGSTQATRTCLLPPAVQIILTTKIFQQTTNFFQKKPPGHNLSSLVAFSFSMSCFHLSTRL